MSAFDEQVCAKCGADLAVVFGIAPLTLRCVQCGHEEVELVSAGDLSPCNHLPLPSENLVSIGWLSREAKFDQEEVPMAFFEKLRSLCVEPWQPVVAAGKHYCDLCQFEGPGFSSNVFVPYGGCIYVAPVAVLHYIAVHWYKPPEVFIQAVMDCPTMNSMEYKKALLANGGRSLVRATSA